MESARGRYSQADQSVRGLTLTLTLTLTPNPNPRLKGAQREHPRPAWTSAFRQLASLAPLSKPVSVSPAPEPVGPATQPGPGKSTPVVFGATISARRWTVAALAAVRGCNFTGSGPFKPKEQLKKLHGRV